VHSIKTQQTPHLQFKRLLMPIPVSIPKATIAMEEANILAWRKQPGEHVVKDEILFEMETDKVVVEVPAPASGTLLRIDVAEGLAKLDRPVGWIGNHGETIPENAEPPRAANHTTFAIPSVAPPTTSASPAARRRARELKLDLSKLRGTGPGGRITEADVDSAGGQP
jgi:pyruvate/2-oxoglutarate dehydrogenase complex dihydrolipoamide acyltransferase (E2) component